MKNFLGNKGFSIVEATLAAGLLGFVGLAGMQVSKMSSSNLIMQDSTILSQSLANQFENFLENISACTNTLNGVNISADRTLSVIKDKNGATIFSVGNSYEGILLSSLMVLKPVSGNGTHMDATGGVGFVDLEAKFQRKESSTGSKDMTRKVRLWVLTDAAGIVQKCTALTTSEDNLWRRSYWDASKIVYQGGSVGVGAPVGAMAANLLIVSGGRLQAATDAGNKMTLESTDGVSSYELTAVSNLPFKLFNETTGATIDTRMNSLTVHTAIQAGSNPTTCSAAIAGAIRYNSSLGANQVCAMTDPISGASYRWITLQ
ncbi:MAG: hypothetical protein ACJ76H_02870 [Bacteriovoracaceae bacterium]